MFYRIIRVTLLTVKCTTRKPMTVQTFCANVELKKMSRTIACGVCGKWSFEKLLEHDCTLLISSALADVRAAYTAARVYNVLF